MPRGAVSRVFEEDGMPAGRPRKNQKDVLIKSAEMIGWAIGGLEREISQTRERLAALTTQAAKLRARAGVKAGRALGSAGAAAAAGEAPVRKRRRNKMSAEARKRISDMMKKRWAERRKEK
ncbi:MAG: hypothetical protein ABJC51_01735 [Acidobacteriota bacterium]